MASGSMKKTGPGIVKKNFNKGVSPFQLPSGISPLVLLLLTKTSVP